MSKINFEDYLSDYIDGNMQDNEKEEFELILSNNEVLRKQVEELKTMLSDVENIDTKIQKLYLKKEKILKF